MTMPRPSLIGGMAALCLVVLSGVAGSVQKPSGPTARQPAGPSPSRIFASKAARTPPDLSASGQQARNAVLEFIKWAGASRKSENELIRKTIAAAAENKEVAGILCDEAFKAQKADHSRALLVLSILGEMRSSNSTPCLDRFMSIPFPQAGTVVDGEIIEQTALATLQAKAIDGLAYLRNDVGDKAVLEAVRSHPSIIVRGEAIEAYLWNHRDAPADARKMVAPFIRKGEQIYLDRVTRESGEKAETFNRKLQAYLKAHPEVLPPAPKRGQLSPKQPDSKQGFINPPRW